MSFTGEAARSNGQIVNLADALTNFTMPDGTKGQCVLIWGRTVGGVFIPLLVDANGKIISTGIFEIDQSQDGVKNRVVAKISQVSGENVVHPTGSVSYDANSVAVTDSYPAQAEVVADQLTEFWAYPTIACSIKLNGSAKEIFLPAETWTPIFLKVESFMAKAIAPGGVGTVYWKGYY